MANTQLLLLEVAGFLNLIAQGIQVPNEKEQATELLEKIGKALEEIGKPE